MKNKPKHAVMIGFDNQKYNVANNPLYTLEERDMVVVSETLLAIKNMVERSENLGTLMDELDETLQAYSEKNDALNVIKNLPI